MLDIQQHICIRTQVYQYTVLDLSVHVLGYSFTVLQYTVLDIYQYTVLDLSVHVLGYPFTVLQYTVLDIYQYTVLDLSTQN